MTDRSCRPLKALFFDAGGTLLGAQPSVGAVYAEVLGRGGRRLDGDRLEAAFRAAWQRSESRAPRGQDRFAAAGGTRAFWRRLLDETVLEAGGECALGPDEFDAVHGEFSRAERYRVYPDVRPALERARDRGFTLGIISNWDDRLRGILAQLDLARFFSVWVVSAEEGCEKPAAAMFERACARAGVQPCEAAHVGDSAVEDFDAARSAGLQAFLLERAGPAHGAGVISHLGAMLDLLDAGQEEVG